MSDTTTITPEERAEILAHFERRYTDPCREAEYGRTTAMRLLNSLEQAEARAEKAGNTLQAASDCIVSGDHTSDVGLFLECDEFDKKLLVDIAALRIRAEKAEAENARLQQRVNEMLSEELTDGAVRERIQLRGNMHEVLQQNELLTKERDWLAEKHIRCAANGEQFYGPTIGKELHVPMYPSKAEAIDALKEAARLAVAAGEG